MISKRRGPIRIAALGFVLARMEAPFIAEWAYYLALQGVSKLLLSIDGTNRVWSKKPRRHCYCPDLDDASFAVYWQDQLKLASEHLEVESVVVEHSEAGFHRARRRVWTQNLRQLHGEGFDWVLAHDVDEFFVPLRHATLADYLSERVDSDGVLVKQLVFESRWGPANGHRPRPVVTLDRYNPKVVSQTKFAVRPGQVARITTHQCVLHEGSMRHEHHETLVMHHYRGIESTRHPEIAAVTDFPSVLEKPLYRSS